MVSMFEFVLFACFLSSVCKSTTFDSWKSSTFHIDKQRQFELSYLDGTKLSGFICEDVLRIGNIQTSQHFGCISPKSDEFMMPGEPSGILGLGFPYWPGSGIDPTNFLSTATIQNNLTLPRLFSLIFYDDSNVGELQLGGVDLSRVKVDRSKAVRSPVIPDCELCSECGSTPQCNFKHFRVLVDSIRLGDQILFDKSEYNNVDPLSAVIDSGTTCLVLPTRVGTERLYSDIFTQFMHSVNIAAEGNMEYTDWRKWTMPSLFIRINDQEFEIPFSSYVFSADRWTQQVSPGLPPLCVLTIPELPRLFLLGDVFMQRVVTIHNLTDIQNPEVILIPRVFGDRKASTMKMGLFDTAPNSVQMPTIRRSIPSHFKRLTRRLGGVNNLHMHLDANDDGRLPLTSVKLHDLLGIEYVTELAVGTPPQHNLTVIVDTGSGSLAIYTTSQYSISRSGIIDILYYSAIVVICVLVLFGLFTCVMKWSPTKSNHFKSSAVVYSPINAEDNL